MYKKIPKYKKSGMVPCPMINFNIPLIDQQEHNLSPLALDTDEWEKTARQHAFSLNDLKLLHPGDQIKFLVLDRNVYDIACDTDTNPASVPVEPEQFFRYNSATYTHHDKTKGELIYHWKDQEYTDSSFEFHIEYKQGQWYPLKHESLPQVDPQGGFDFGEQAGKHYLEFPGTTLVGWRGKMIPWNKLSQLPKIYYTQDIMTKLEIYFNEPYFDRIWKRKDDENDEE
jgi:hypothetical protein